MIFTQPETLTPCPTRIVSLVPSITELLYDLQLGKEIVGITKFCVHPKEWQKEKTRIGGTKQVHLDKLTALHPDLVIANKEENVKEQVDKIGQQFPVWLTDVNSFEGALEMIRDTGIITCREKQAREMISSIREEFNQLVKTPRPLRCAYIIWKDPWMTVGGDTYISDMLAKAGYENVFSGKERYPGIEPGMITTANCDIIFLSSEPYPFKEKHFEAARQSFGELPVVLVDGEMFSWYGSRLKLVPAYLQNLRERILFNFPSLL